MLRITTHDQTDVLALQVEGKLAGPWVAILRDCWEQQSSLAHGRVIELDLRAVTFVDAEGRNCLQHTGAIHA